MSPSLLPDQILLAHVETLAARERAVTAELITCLGEVDERRLYLGLGCSSLFVYCTDVLHLSEHAAYGRIQAARCARRFPQILERLSDGSLTLTAITLLAPVMTERNIDVLLASAANKAKREIERLVAAVRPLPPCATFIRKNPAAALPQTPSPKATSTPAPTASSFSPDAEKTASRPSADTLIPPALSIGEIIASSTPPQLPPGALLPDASSSAASLSGTAFPAVLPPRTSRKGSIQPLDAETYRVQFTLSRDGYKYFRRAQDLLRHRLPSGDPGTIFERALSILVIQLEKKKQGATKPSRALTPPTLRGRSRSSPTRSRHIPASVRRAVWKRDGGRCAFVAASGRRCRETGFLEFHHVVPFADGGETSVKNVQLRCRAHNQHEIALWAPEDGREIESPGVTAALGPDRVERRTLESSKPPP